MRGEKKEGWINIYKVTVFTKHYGACIYSTKEEAYESRDGYNYIATTKIEWEE